MQFSIKQLVILTSLIAVLLGAFTALGPRIVQLAAPICILFGIAFAGVAAHKNKIPVPFWKCFLVYALIFYWGTNWHTGPQSEGESVSTAVIFAIGIVLSFSSVRDGHWATKIMGMLVLLPIVLFVSAHILNALQNWPDLVEYWLS